MIVGVNVGVNVAVGASVGVDVNVGAGVSVGRGVSVAVSLGKGVDVGTISCGIVQDASRTKIRARKICFIIVELYSENPHLASPASGGGTRAYA